MKTIYLLSTAILFFCFSCEDKNVEKPVEVKPEKSEENHLMKGNEFLLKSDFQNASASFDSLLKKDSANASALFGKGTACEMQGDYQTAIEYYSKAINLDPKFTMAYYKRANSEKLVGDNQAALADLKKSVELKPDFAVAIVEIAHLEAKPGKETDKAIIDMITQSLSAKPDADILYQFRGNYRYYLGESKAALEDFNQALKINPKNIESLYYSGIIYGEMKDYAKAIENLTKVTELNGYKSAYLYRGVYYYNKGETEKACVDFTKAKQGGETTAENYIKQYCSK